MCVLEFTDVYRGYGGDDVLAGLNLQIKQGEVIGLLGRNGAGKTTLIRLVMGTLIPNKGTVKVFGEGGTVILDIAVGPTGTGLDQTQ